MSAASFGRVHGGRGHPISSLFSEIGAGLLEAWWPSLHAIISSHTTSTRTHFLPIVLNVYIANKADHSSQGFRNTSTMMILSQFISFEAG